MTLRFRTDNCIKIMRSISAPVKETNFALKTSLSTDESYKTTHTIQLELS